MKAPNVIFIDVESSGLLKDRLPLDDPQQPFAVSIAAALCDPEGEFVNFARLLIKPEGRSIQVGAEKVHGISAREAAQFGVPEARALGLVSDFLKTMPMDSWLRCVSYGNFDRQILSSLFARFAVSQGKASNAYDRLWHKRPMVEFIDIMDPFATQLCKIKSEHVEGTYRWPSLDEAAQHILGKPPREGCHDCWEDMLTLRALYLEMDKRGLFGKELAT